MIGHFCSLWFIHVLVKVERDRRSWARAGIKETMKIEAIRQFEQQRGAASSAYTPDSDEALGVAGDGGTSGDGSIWTSTDSVRRFPATINVPPGSTLTVPLTKRRKTTCPSNFTKSTTPWVRLAFGLR